jgi:hypothetical protein
LSIRGKLLKVAFSLILVTVAFAGGSKFCCKSRKVTEHLPGFNTNEENDVLQSYAKEMFKKKHLIIFLSKFIDTKSTEFLTLVFLNKRTFNCLKAELGFDDFASDFAAFYSTLIKTRAMRTLDNQLTFSRDGSPKNSLVLLITHFLGSTTQVHGGRQYIHLPQLMHSFRFYWAIALLSEVKFLGNNCLILEYEFQNTRFATLRHKSIVLTFFLKETSGAAAAVGDWFVVEGANYEWKWYKSARDIPHVSNIVYITKENFPMLLKSAKY